MQLPNAQRTLGTMLIGIIVAGVGLFYLYARTSKSSTNVDLQTAALTTDQKAPLSNSTPLPEIESDAPPEKAGLPIPPAASEAINPQVPSPPVARLTLVEIADISQRYNDALEKQSEAQAQFNEIIGKDRTLGTLIKVKTDMAMAPIGGVMICQMFNDPYYASLLKATLHDKQSVGDYRNLLTTADKQLNTNIGFTNVKSGSDLLILARDSQQQMEDAYIKFTEKIQLSDEESKAFAELSQYRMTAAILLNYMRLYNCKYDTTQKYFISQ